VFLAGGRPDRKASSLRTEDHSALKDPVVPRGLLRRAGRPSVLLPVEVGPGFPWGSLVFLFVPSRRLSRLLGGGTPRAGYGIPAGQRPVALVGVTGFEPAASSSRTGDHSSLLCRWARGAASRARKRCVRFVRCGPVGLGLFLFCSPADVLRRRPSGAGAAPGS